MTITKNATLLPGIIAETSDHEVQVSTFTDNGQSAIFTLGHEWLATGKGFCTDMEAEDKWRIMHGTIDFKDGVGIGVVNFTVAPDGKSMTLKAMDEYVRDPGTYPNSKIDILISKDGHTEPFVLPFTLKID